MYKSVCACIFARTTFQEVLRFFYYVVQHYSRPTWELKARLGTDIAIASWIPKTVAYEIYNEHKNIEISKRLPRLQIILKAKLMALYDTIKLSITQYQHEHVYIFIDSLNSLYLLNTQIKHPSLHNNHLDKIILAEMVQMLQNKTYRLFIYKVRAHSNIIDNE